ncbi:MAG TPA: FxLYD domain-containing protein [Anaerolineales bacterium]|nr:FxLYD domain-containing protein [Anaerolineales bacterium]
MKNAPNFAIVILVVSLAVLACGSSARTEAAPQDEDEGDVSTETSVETAAAEIPVSSPVPTTAKLQLEVVQSQTWTDYQGNARVNVLLRNPYDFPVALSYGGHATLKNSAGKLMKDGGLYFLDGISGGGGFILPGETIAANSCFTCEAALLTEEWASVEFEAGIVDATGKWDYSTKVEAAIGDVTFDGDSPIFWASGTVKNNSDSILDRISVRVIVFDQVGNLVGAAEVSAWDVGPGATANFNGYGIGETPDGPVKYEVTAVGVNY